MARRNFSKRVLAIVLSAVMCLSAMQLSAFAEKQDSQVMHGYFVLDENGNVLRTTDSASNEENGFAVSKTIAQTGENTFDITLEVQTSQTVTTNASAIQLVIDRSNSMEYCADCGSEYPSYCGCNAGTRMSAVKSAITGKGGFLDKLLTQNQGKLYISVVVFSGHASNSSVADAKTVLGWTELTPVSKISIANVINSISSNGGTNLDAGLTLAANRLQMSDIAACSTKYTVLLTDGAPTYYTGTSETSTQEINGTQGNGSSASDSSIAGGQNAASRVKALSTLYTICFGVSDEQLRQAEYVCTYCGEQEDEHASLCVHCLQTRNAHTRGNSGSRRCPDGSRNTYERGYFCDENGTNRYTPTVTGGLTVGQYLSNFVASSSGTAYDAEDIDGVYSAFSNIASSAISGMTGAGTTVTDPMSQYVVLGDVSALSKVEASNGTLTWNLDSDTLVNTTVSGDTTTYTYRITYPITLNTAAEGFQEVSADGSIKYYPANDYTYLSVVTDGGTVKVPFHVPGVRGTVPQLSYQVEYYLQADAAAGDYARYTLDTAVTPASVKAWTVVNAPAGYADRYADRFYTFAYGSDQLQVTPGGENVIRLYYNRISADVTVNHFYKTDVVNSSGTTVPGAYPAVPQKTASADAYAGDTYTATADPSYDGKVYTLVSAQPKQSITVAADGPNVINLYYTRTLNTYAYSVNYNGNGGVLDDNTSAYADRENVSDTDALSHTVHADDNTFRRENHTFTGWNTKPDGTGISYTVNQAIALTVRNNTLTLYAQWQEHPKYDYTVIYNANFGATPETAADSENISDTYATDYTIHVDESSFRRNHHTFIGWATTPNGDVAYQPGDSIQFTQGGSQTLYARWVEHDRNSYSLIYNGNGGADASGSLSYGDSENISDTYATAYAIGVDANSFVRENYTFTGWNTDPNGSGKAYTEGASVELTAGNNTLTLYAQWQEHPKYDYTVIYNANFGATPETAADSENVSDTYATSYSITVDASGFNRENYTFAGWNTDPNGNGTAYAPNQAIALDTVNNTQILYAQWQMKPKFDYTVVYDANFGAPAETAADSENVAGIFARTYAIGVDSDPFTRANHTFTGWNTKPDGTGVTYQPGDSVALTAAYNTQILYAQWEENPRYDYTLTYNANFGAPAETRLDSESITGIFALTHNIRVNANPFTRENYTFTGWNTDPNGNGTAYAPGAQIQLTCENNAAVLYAQWQRNPQYSYSLTYNANFGEAPATASDSENVTDTFATSHTVHVDANPFTRENYTFIGWNTEADGTGTPYAAGASRMVLTPANNASVLYAQWQINPKYDYTVVYNANFGETPETAADSENVTDTFAASHTIGVDANPFTREHYTFLGWAVEPNGQVAYQSGDFFLFLGGGEQTLYAQWQEDDKFAYTLIYNGNGGKLEDESLSYGDAENITDTYATSHDLYVDANAFVLENHTFTGWNTRPDGTGLSYSTDDIITLNRTKDTETLYAQWQENPKYDYTVTYNANFGEAPTTVDDSENVIGTYATSHSLGVDENTFLREHYTLTGWNTMPDGSGTAYSAYDVITLNVEIPTQTLYAQWSVNEYPYLVAYLTRVDGNAYQSFTGTLPEDAPTGGILPYGTVIDTTLLAVPESLTDALHTYDYTAIEVAVNPDASVVVMVYYTYISPATSSWEPLIVVDDPGGEVTEIPEEPVPMAEVPKTGDPLVMYAALTALSGAGLVAMGLMKKKKEETDGE